MEQSERRPINIRPPCSIWREQERMIRKISFFCCRFWRRCCKLFFSAACGDLVQCSLVNSVDSQLVGVPGHDTPRVNGGDCARRCWPLWPRCYEWSCGSTHRGWRLGKGGGACAIIGSNSLRVLTGGWCCSPFISPLQPLFMTVIIYYFHYIERILYIIRKWINLNIFFFAIWNMPSCIGVTPMR